MDTNTIIETAARGVVGLIVVGAFLGWAKEYNPGGPFTFLIDPIATIATFALDPSMAILIFAATAVIASLRGSDGF